MQKVTTIKQIFQEKILWMGKGVVNDRCWCGMKLICDKPVKLTYCMGVERNHRTHRNNCSKHWMAISFLSPTTPAGAGALGLKNHSANSASRLSVKSMIIFRPDRCKSQPVRPNMCADHCRHIDHQDIARYGLAGFLHHHIQELLGTRFGTGVQNGQSFQSPFLQEKIQDLSLPWLDVRTALMGLTSLSFNLINGLMLSRLPRAATTPGTRPLRLRFSMVEGGVAYSGACV